MTAHLGGVDEFARELICPLMVGADQLADRSAAARQKPRAAMAADVEMRADLFVVAAHDDNRVAPDIPRDEVAWLRHLRLDAHEDPMLGEDRLEVEREYLR